jgi:predicted Fe-Mo cluster-binding NifX family protein
MSKVCVPSAGRGGLEDLVGEHFGRVPTYTIYDSETGATDVVDNTSEHAGGSGLPADILSHLGIDVLLCSGLGRRAIGILSENGIDVCVGVTGTVREALDAWKAGNVSSASEGDACQRHAFRDRHH